MNMLFKNRGAFSLRDETGTFSNIEVGIQLIYKSPFIISPFYVKEEDKPVIKKFQRLNMAFPHIRDALAILVYKEAPDGKPYQY